MPVDHQWYIFNSVFIFYLIFNTVVCSKVLPFSLLDFEPGIFKISRLLVTDFSEQHNYYCPLKRKNWWYLNERNLMSGCHALLVVVVQGVYETKKCYILAS